jgi:hypothetical protein
MNLLSIIVLLNISVLPQHAVSSTINKALDEHNNVSTDISAVQSLALKPREKKYADSIGSYSLGIRVINPIVNPGEILKFELFISGYGRISTPGKIFMLPSSDFIDQDSDSSFIRCGAKFEKDSIRGEVWGFGGETYHIGNEGATLILGGPRNPTWEECSFFIDAIREQDEFNNQILTETRPHLPSGSMNAPISGSLKISKNARSGSHSISFVFSYFDGSKWRSETCSGNLTIRSFYQRNEMLVWTIGLLAGICSIIWNLFNILRFGIDKLKRAIPNDK